MIFAVVTLPSSGPARSQLYRPMSMKMLSTPMMPNVLSSRQNAASGDDAVVAWCPDESAPSDDAPAAGVSSGRAAAVREVITSDATHCACWRAENVSPSDGRAAPFRRSSMRPKTREYSDRHHIEPWRSIQAAT